MKIHLKYWLFLIALLALAAGPAYALELEQVQVQVQKLLAGDGAADDEFGWSVSISGDTAPGLRRAGRKKMEMASK
jgi:hypothetical protein